MKKWIILLISVIALSACSGGDGHNQDHNHDHSTDKGNHSEEALWLTDFDKASAIAKKEGKHMLVDFSGSDWCGWCIKLDKEVFVKPAFIEYAKENLVLVLIDFPNSKPQSDDEKAKNKALAEKHEVTSFPTVLVFNPEGEKIKKTGYREGGPEAYVAHLKEIVGK